MIKNAFPYLFVALIVAIANSAMAAPRDLLAAASDEAVVIARVLPPDKTDPDASTDHTLVLARRLGKETRWRKLATLSRRVISIAVCDEDAKVLLDSGDWMTLWADGSAFGPPAPNVRLIAFAADHSDLWALGVPAPASTQPAATTQGASTQVASTQTTSTQSPNLVAASAPAWPRTKALYKFDGANWVRVMALPPELGDADPSTFSLAIIEHQPILASSNGPTGIRVWTAETDHWSNARDFSSTRPLGNFDILNAGLPPTLWLTEGGPGVLANIAGDRPLGPDGAAAGDPRSATRAAEAIRLYSASGDHLYEQAYGSDGSPMGKRAELAIDLVNPDSQVQNWLAPTLTVIVTMLLFGAARRGGVGELPESLAQANLTLAPLFPRFIAGLIDALPVLLSILYVAREMQLAGISDDVPTNDQMIPFYVGSGIYLLYTIATEMLLGKTLGKWIFGLQIVNVEGGPPPRVAILVRNLLRIIDLVLIFLPLAMMLFSPLRQRIGDIAAGTLVVRPAQPPKPEV